MWVGGRRIAYIVPLLHPPEPPLFLTEGSCGTALILPYHVGLRRVCMGVLAVATDQVSEDNAKQSPEIASDSTYFEHISRQLGTQRGKLPAIQRESAAPLLGITITSFSYPIYIILGKFRDQEPYRHSETVPRCISLNLLPACQRCPASPRQTTKDDKCPWAYLQALTVFSISLGDIIPPVATKITLQYCQLAQTVDIHISLQQKHHVHTRFFLRYNAFYQGRHLHLHRESSINSGGEPPGD